MLLEDLGPIWGQSGVKGFFGEGYWFHHVWTFLRWITFELFGFTFKRVTFVAKTTTLHLKPGNIELDGVKPKRFFPDCVVVKPWAGVVLNAIGLSGPGAHALFQTGLWQKRKEPFFISFMPVAATMTERIEEFRQFVALLKSRYPEFEGMFGLQLNLTCPNIAAHSDDLVREANALLDIAAEIMAIIPTVVKLSVETAPEDAVAIAKHSACAAICCSNTIKYGRLPHRINWKALFGSDESPLAKYGGGGLSGAPLLPLVVEWVQTVRRLGLTKHINAGGGILCADDVDSLHRAGANSVSIGVAAMIRPWRLRSIIRRARKLFRRKRLVIQEGWLWD